MNTIRTVHMVWEKRIRGSYPTARYALDDAGALTLAVPRPLEARTYDLMRLALDGGIEVRAGFAVETLLKLEVAARADDFLGMTADDLYLFQPPHKLRFLGDRRLTYIDAALSADGLRVAAAFSDMAGASYALAMGEIGGRVLWTLDVDASITVVVLSYDGTRLAWGAENGLIHLTDAARRDVWTFAQSEPIRALACSRDGVFTAYSTQEGAMGLIDGDGARLWEVHLEGVVTALALSADGQRCAALCQPHQDPGSTRMVCVVGNGQIGWEYDAEKRLVSLSLSPEGRYLATGARDGTQAVYEIVPGEGRGVGGSGVLEEAQAQASERAQAGDREGATRALRRALEAHPADVALYEAFIQQRGQWLQTRLAEAKERTQAGDFDTAIALLTAVLREEPIAGAVLALQKAQDEKAQRLLEEARAHNATGDPHAAEGALLAAITLAPLLPDARRELAALHAFQATAAAAQAERLLAQGDLETGMAALERAQAFAPTAERAEMLARAQIAYEHQAGMDAYHAKRYREAVFQFKKVLARDPDHPEAKRTLGYAQKLAQDAAQDSLGDRFRRLE